MKELKNKLKTDTNSKRVALDITRLSLRYKKHNVKEKLKIEGGGKFFAISKDYKYDTKSFTYIMGEEATTLGNIPEDLEIYEIPAAKYAMFTVRPNKAVSWSKAIMGNEELYL